MAHLFSHRKPAGRPSRVRTAREAALRQRVSGGWVAEGARWRTLQDEVTRILAVSPDRDGVDATATAVAASIARAAGWPLGRYRSAEAEIHTETHIQTDAGDTASALARAAEALSSRLWRQPVALGERWFGSFAFDTGGGPADRGALDTIVAIAAQTAQFLARCHAEAELRCERASLAARVVERTTELTETNRRLDTARLDAENANRAKSAFLATMSHEIRTPMNGVIGMVEVLAESTLGEDQADAVRTIRASAFSLLGLIDDILDFSKIEAGHLDLEHAPVDLTELVEGIRDVFGIDAAARGVDLRIFIAPDVPEQVRSDATRLRQMLSNLVGNAVKFSGGRPQTPGVVSLRIELADTAPLRLRMSVTDNGIGIDAAMLGSLFTSFTQAETTTTRRFGGSGLGLAICKRLVELMGGSIQVRSEPQVGSTFTIMMPIEAIGSALRRNELAGLDCIVVAHPAIDADDLGVYLEHAGARVSQAPGGRSAARTATRLGEGAVVVIQHCGAGSGAAQVARAPFGTRANVRHVLIASARLKNADMIIPGVVVLETALLRRSSLLRAVAAAGGRMVAPDQKAVRPPPRPGRSLAPTITQARAQNRLILVAEDDEVNQKVILKQLGLLGHAAEVAGNGAEALRLWREGGHALLLSDLHMPELDGYGLARAIRDAESRQPGPQRLPILALTANALRDEAQRVRAAGMDQYLTKPIQLQALAAALDRWMPRTATTAAVLAAAAAATPSTAPRPGTLPVDVSVLKSLVGDDMATVCDFLAQFLDSARAQAAEIIASCVREDNRRVGAVAHKLKASSRSVGALALGDLCAELENVSVAGSKAELAEGCARFESELRDVQDCIREVLAETSP